MTSKAVAAELSRGETLNRNNFLTWKRRIRHILLQDHLDYVLDGEVAKPPENAELGIIVACEKCPR